MGNNKLHAFYDDRMVAPADSHSTPSHIKPKLLRQYLLEKQRPIQWEPFKPVTVRDLKLVHKPKYVDSVLDGNQALYEQAQVSWSAELVQSLMYTCGSMVAAAEAAITQGVAISMSSGFHHAHFASPGVFCLFNGLVLCAVKMQQLHQFEKPILILDCDYHYGNGTDDILGRFVHQPDIAIAHRTLGRKFKRPYEAEDYLIEIDDIARRIRNGAYSLVLYQAGMDVLIGDPMGGGILTYDQAKQRDLTVFKAAKLGAVPIAWNLAGGYRKDESGSILPVLKGHLGTVDACLQAFEIRH